MFILILRMQIPPARRKDVFETVNALIGPTQIQPGCLACHAYVDIDSDSGLLLIEQWRSRKHLQRHIQSEDFRKVLALVDLSATVPEFSIHTVAGSMGLDEISGLYPKTAGYCDKPAGGH